MGGLLAWNGRSWEFVATTTPPNDCSLSDIVIIIITLLKVVTATQQYMYSQEHYVAYKKNLEKMYNIAYVTYSYVQTIIDE